MSNGVVYKYPIGNQNAKGLALPRGARLLHVDIQPGTGLCLWAMVDASATVDQIVQVSVVGTGKDTACDPDDYMGTVMATPFVWHVFIDTTGAEVTR